MAADTALIDTTDLRKTYDGIDALRGVTLQVPAGSICGFLGRNGAGKTTTIKILLGMAHATAGQARVFGLDAHSAEHSLEIRRRTGFVSEEKDLYGYMTVAEMIRFTAGFFPRWRGDLAQRYLQVFELPADRAIKALSRGMRTKLALLIAICSGAELLILDEPTAGLDPVAIEQTLQTLVALAARSETTILLSTHQLSDVDQIADHIAIVDRGRTLVQGALDDVRASYCRVQLVFGREAPEITLKSPGIVAAKRQGRVLKVLSSAGSARVLEEARAHEPVSLEVLPVTLKEIFIETVAGEGTNGLA
jgi:ABC-type multidrug transport system ATPase subunit